MNRYDMKVDAYGRVIRIGWQAETEKSARKEAAKEGWKVLEVQLAKENYVPNELGHYVPAQ